MRIIAIATCLNLLALPAFAQSGTEDAYLDNRTDAVSLITSYYNAINRHEYARAWSYWGAGDAKQDYDAFVKGFAGTDHVDLVTGTPEEEGAAGSVYTSLPVAISAKGTDGKTSSYAGCYLVHWVEPSIQEPPFTPLFIEKAKLEPASGSYKDAVPKTCAF